ncbi:MAG: hypothetical protein KGK09_07290 [Burkholderiales bacterium]|nr:hypothetical protein [Burkholderiales bacterium]
MAVLIASWEQLRGRRAPEGDVAPGTAAPTRPSSVDIELEPAPALRGAAAGGGDLRARRQALGGALDRMAQPAPRPPAGWTDTEPMVGPGAREPAPVPSRPKSAATH